MYKKVTLLLLGLLLIGIFPVTAQDESILDIASGSSDFDTLVAAIEAANLTDALSGEGPFTVFAPTDAAFNRAFDALGVDAEDLLAQPEVLEDILEYHVVEGAVLSSDLSGGDVETLNGESIQVNVFDETVTINDATVIQADIVANNGVVHVIDTVLLPSDFIPVYNVTEVTENADVYLRAAHFAADAPFVDVYVNGEIAIRALGYGRVSDWVGADEGTIEIAVVPANNSIEEAVLTQELELTEGTWATGAAIGNIGDDTLAFAPFIEDNSPVGDGFVRATFFNAITAEGAPFGPIIDYYADGQRLVEALRYPASRGGADGAFSRQLPQGLYDFAVTLTGSPQIVLASLPDAPLTEGRYYLVATLGEAEDAFSIVVETVDARND
jgi:uncharacterized surface protein with fasciclin (FAS1) repeats